MFRSNRFYPVLAITIFSLAVLQTRAQQTTSQPQSTEQTQPTQTSPQERAQVLRQAQERVKARRKLRDQQTIQDTYTHKYEAYFGGNYLRFHPGDHLQRINEKGWHAGITDYAFGKIGITVDGRGYYGTTYTGPNPYGVYQPSISQYTFMGGPTVRFFEGVHWAWTGHVLAGVGHGNFGTGTGGLPPELIGLYSDGNAFNLTAGASVDYNLSPTLAVRLTPSYLMSRYGGSTQNNLGFTAGVVWRWGRQ
ncbi:hypothetical protein H7849_00250 [Alloacidobacterium dinghuense]|uniref:Uncharacterized protein n=1 Tax=Alloacidobacterium dinghuense TaxID=2763107 RepID=A0A7G8BIY2_9BACT|nr:hypothetical protein [Alloacidobacterium dinghuense]QNI32502.1 hypothetical protein H7849_00250 [Alloacidobacterium dinghuense]